MLSAHEDARQAVGWHGSIAGTHLSNVSNVNGRAPSLLLDSAREAVQDIHDVVVVVPAQTTDIIPMHRQEGHLHLDVQLLLGADLSMLSAMMRSDLHLFQLHQADQMFDLQWMGSFMQAREL